MSGVYREISVRVWQDSTSAGRGWAWAVYDGGKEIRRGWTNVSYQQATVQAERFVERLREGGA